MSIPPRVRNWLIFFATVSLIVIAGRSCSPKMEETAAYQASCHGAPLRSPAEKNAALEAGYSINRNFPCIDKASYLAMQKAEEDRAYWRSPAGIAQREAEDRQRQLEFEQRKAERAAQRAREEAAKGPATYSLRLVDVNTGSSTELAAICNLNQRSAESITEERTRNGAFASWADLVHRVVAMSAAQSVVVASTCGLTVNGESFHGAPANQPMAQRFYEQYRR